MSKTSAPMANQPIVRPHETVAGESCATFVAPLWRFKFGAGAGVINRFYRLFRRVLRLSPGREVLAGVGHQVALPQKEVNSGSECVGTIPGFGIHCKEL